MIRGQQQIRPMAWPDIYDHRVVKLEMRKKSAGEPYDEEAWEKLARVITPKSIYWDLCPSELPGHLESQDERKRGRPPYFFEPLTMQGRWLLAARRHIYDAHSTHINLQKLRTEERLRKSCYNRNRGLAAWELMYYAVSTSYRKSIVISGISQAIGCRSKPQNTCKHRST
jgi:hypothetical protein